MNKKNLITSMALILWLAACGQSAASPTEAPIEPSIVSPPVTQIPEPTAAVAPVNTDEPEPTREETDGFVIIKFSAPDNFIPTVTS